MTITSKWKSTNASAVAAFGLLRKAATSIASEDKGMRRKKLRSPWECDSADDYYEQFEDQAVDEDDFSDPQEDFEPFDDDCEYWKFN